MPKIDTLVIMSGRLIADIIETTEIIKKEGFLVTMDIEKNL